MKRYGILTATVAWFFLSMMVHGQGGTDYPRDTSYSVWSSYKKISREFPQAVPVKEYANLPIEAERDKVYATAGKRDLHMDIFWPEGGDKKIPAVICIHGGGWASGNKSHLVPLAQQLALYGSCAASVEYRLSPEAKYPAAVFDVKAAILWIKKNAEQYNIDTSKIVILGASAGATIASLVGTSAGKPLYIADSTGHEYSDRVQAIVNIDGILDFTDPAESGKDADPGKPSAAARWFACTYKENPAVWEEASPLSYVDGSTPPTLFINSSIPRFHAGREQYLDVLQNSRTYYEVHTLPGTPHTFWLFHPWFDDVLPLISGFLSVVFN